MTGLDVAVRMLLFYDVCLWSAEEGGRVVGAGGVDCGEEVLPDAGGVGCCFAVAGAVGEVRGVGGVGGWCCSLRVLIGDEGVLG